VEQQTARLLKHVVRCFLRFVPLLPLYRHRYQTLTLSVD
jgi:hypothetical protein